ncbi:MAG TPA: hypothetical protein PKA34_18505 [Blastocatellia bacterium]|nr:hypothetical protein [Blastocatellia bacterium]HNG28344.1 hypothetical protein [Blastocatellia bacterium]
MLKQFKLCFFLLTLCLSAAISGAQPQRKTIHIFLEVRETNLEKPSTVAVNTLSERLAAAGFRVTTKKREAELVIEGSFASRPTAVTDDVKREGGVNAEASASLRLLAGNEVIATSVERSAPGDWGVNAERLGEDRLIEVAGRVAEELFSGDFVQEVKGVETKSSTDGKPQTKPTPRPATRKTSAPKRGVSFLEVASLVQNFAPEDRIVAALKKYGIKFKPRDAAISQLRSLGASEAVINAVKSSIVNS